MLVVGLKKIAHNYVTGWFLIDLVAIMPVQIFNSDATGSEFKLAKLARLPRLYKLLRIMRMVKMIRIIRKSALFQEMFDTISIGVGMMRLIKILVMTFFMVHLMACFWFM